MQRLLKAGSPKKTQCHSQAEVNESHGSGGIQGSARTPNLAAVPAVDAEKQPDDLVHETIELDKYSSQRTANAEKRADVLTVCEDITGGFRCLICV